MKNVIVSLLLYSLVFKASANDTSGDQGTAAANACDAYIMKLVKNLTPDNCAGKFGPFITHRKDTPCYNSDPAKDFSENMIFDAYKLDLSRAQGQATFRYMPDCFTMTDDECKTLAVSMGDELAGDYERAKLDNTYDLYKNNMDDAATLARHMKDGSSSGAMCPMKNFEDTLVTEMSAKSSDLAAKYQATKAQGNPSQFYLFASAQANTVFPGTQQDSITRLKKTSDEKLTNGSGTPNKAADGVH